MTQRFFIVHCINTIRVDRHYETKASDVQHAIDLAKFSHGEWWDKDVVKIEPYLVEEEMPKSDGDGWHYVKVWEKA